MTDTHAHFCHIRFENRFRGLFADGNATEYEIREGSREDILRQMSESGIRYAVEPAIGYETNRRILNFSRENPTVLPALGVHPERVANTFDEGKTVRLSLFRIRSLNRMIRENRETVVAVGETGLDFHRKPEHRIRQYLWFCAQIRIAHRFRLPLILHIRQADEEALRILTRHRKQLHGGVVHCFTGDFETAEKYVALGFHIGVGGSLLSPAPVAEHLTEAVRRLPLSALLTETDAPYVLPPFDCGLSERSRQKVRNTPQTVFPVLRRIAELKGISEKEAEEICDGNADRVFRKNR